MTSSQPPASFTRIVVPVAGSADDAGTLSQAAALAAQAGVDLTVLGVVEPPRDLDRMARAAGVSPEAALADLVDVRRKELASLASQADLARTPAIDVRTGKAFIEIIRAVREKKYDLVLKTAEKIGGLHPFIFASTDQHLLRKCPAPVWLRLPNAPQPPRAVLAAVDVDTFYAAEPETQEALNRLILQTAAQIAAFGDASLEVLHVWDAQGEALVSRWAWDKEAAARYRDDVESSYRSALNALIRATFKGEKRPARIHQRLIRGNARDAIPEHARLMRADLLVMGTIARTGVPGLLIGNTAEDVLHRVDCSVLTVKPPGYVSPIV